MYNIEVFIHVNTHLLSCAVCLFFSFDNNHSMHPAVISRLSRFPSKPFEKLCVGELKYLDLERAAALDHVLLAVLTEAPQRKITTGAGTWMMSANCLYKARSGGRTGSSSG